MSSSPPPQVHELQQELAMLSTHPLLALSEAACLLCERMGADFVGWVAAAFPQLPGFFWL
jgi:hypothetical protein